MDRAAIEALLEIYDTDVAHEMWLKSVIEHSIPEGLVRSQLEHIEEIICADAFYGIIEYMLEPYREQYPFVYAQAKFYNNLVDCDEDSIG